MTVKEIIIKSIDYQVKRCERSIIRHQKDLTWIHKCEVTSSRTYTYSSVLASAKKAKKYHQQEIKRWDKSIKEFELCIERVKEEISDE